MTLEIIVKGSELAAARGVYSRKLDNPLIKFHEKMKVKGGNRSGMMSLEGSVAVDAVETFFGAYGVVKQKLEQMPEAAVHEYKQALNLYALFVAASYSHTRISRNVEGEKGCNNVSSIQNLDDEYLLINELATGYLKGITTCRTCKELAESTRGYFSAIKNVARRVLSSRKYINMVKELQENVQVKFEEGDEEEFGDLSQPTTTKKKKKRKPSKPKIKITFDDVGGNHHAKRLLRNIVESISHPERKVYGWEAPRGVFMYGLPGTGKTLLAKAMAYECGMPFHHVDISEVLSKWHGESERNLKEVMSQEGIIFLDEYDSLGKKYQDHDGTSVKLVNIMAEVMDGYDSNPNALYIAAANTLDIDPKLKRGGRFSEFVEFKVPTQQEIYEILMIHLRKKQEQATAQLFNGVDPKEVAAVLYQKSVEGVKKDPRAAIVGSDVSNIVRQVHDVKWNRFRQTGTFEKISTPDFIPVIQGYNKAARM